MRRISTLLSFFLPLFAVLACAAQTKINPNSQINWPLASGAGAPSAACSSANYGQPYTDTATGVYYVCSATGWAALTTNISFPLSVSNGGTGAATTSGALTNLFAGVTCSTGQAYSPASGTCISTSAVPGGSNGQVQYNNNGSFGGSAATVDANGNVSTPGSVAAGTVVATVPGVNMSADSGVAYGGSQWNLLPYSIGYAVSQGFTVTPQAAPDLENAITYTQGTTEIQYFGQLLSVKPGTYTLSGYIDATQVTGTTNAAPLWALTDPNVSTWYCEAHAVIGQAGRYSTTCTIPSGVTQVFLQGNVAGSYTATGGQIYFSEPQLEVGSVASTYKTTSGTLLQPSMLPGGVNLGINTFGSSFCFGTGATVLANGFCNLLGEKYVGGPYNNYAHGGDASGDVSFYAYKYTNPSFRKSPITVLEGTVNDYNTCGLSTGCVANALQNVTAAMAWSAIPRENKVFGQNGTQCTTTGTWTADNSITTGVAIESTVPGSTITCQMLYGGNPALYIGWMTYGGSNATASLNINSGAVTDTLNAFGNNGQTVATGNGVTTVPAARGYAVSASGTTTFTITVNTASSTYPWEFIWAGEPVLTSVPEPPYSNQSAGMSSVVVVSLPYTGVSDSGTNAFNTMASSVVTLANSLGLNQVVLAQPRNFENATTDYAGPYTLNNGLSCPASTAPPEHPNDCGHAHIADSIMNALLNQNATGTGNRVYSNQPTFDGNGTIFKNSADAFDNLYLQAGETANQSSGVVWSDYLGNIKWYMLQNSLLWWSIQDASAGYLDRFLLLPGSDTEISAGSVGSIKWNAQNGASIYGGCMYSGGTSPVSVACIDGAGNISGSSLKAGSGAAISNTNLVPQASSTQTVGALVCIKSAGPPPIYGTCTAVSGASCTTCN